LKANNGKGFKAILISTDTDPIDFAMHEEIKQRGEWLVDK